MMNLKNTTFIIPVRIESEDRAFNLKHVLQHLCDHLQTNIIVRESDNETKALDIIHSIDQKESTITFSIDKTEEPAFHRTRLLNEMLYQVKTPVVVNYDADIILEPETYLQAQNEILDNGADLVYPYFKGLSQRMVSRDKNGNQASQIHNSICGHCQFFRTSTYREGGMENENFISYGPEDSERMHRFQAMGYKVVWLDNYIWHLEHSRTANSSDRNPFFLANDNLYKKIFTMSEQELRAYYRGQSYLQKYA